MLRLACAADTLWSALQQRDGAETAVGANTDNSAGAFRHRRELLHRLRQNPRAGGGERMAERDAPAVRIHALAWEAAEGVFDAGLGAHEVLILQRLDVAQHLGGERFV